PGGHVPAVRVHQVVELTQVDVVDAEPVQRPVQLLSGGAGGALTRLGGDEETTGMAAQPGRYAQLGVAVGGGDVDVVDVVLEQRLERAIGDILRHACERRAAEDRAAAGVSGATEGERGDRHAPYANPLRAGQLSLQQRTPPGLELFNAIPPQQRICFATRLPAPNTGRCVEPGVRLHGN